MSIRVPFVVALAALVFASSGHAAPPRPDAGLPRTPAGVARALISTTASLRAGIDAWRAAHSPRPSEDVTLYALYAQRLHRLLSGERLLAKKTLALLPQPLASSARDIVTAHRELVRITPPLRVHKVNVGPAAPATNLLRWYLEAERRFGVAWRVLAAVNFVESAFGKLRSASGAGAQGPMQFMPASWRKYGLGGHQREPPSQSELGVSVQIHPRPPLSVSPGRPTASKEGRIEPQPFTTSVGGTVS